MTTPSAAVVAVVILLITVVCQPPRANGLGGSATTIAVAFGSSNTICSIVAEQWTQRIQCWRDGQVIFVVPAVAFDAIAGGRDFFCGLMSGGNSLLCWNSSFQAKRLYYNNSVLLQDLTVGDDQICALTNGTQFIRCWRNNAVSNRLPNGASQFQSISSGVGFSCGISVNSSRIGCWGTKPFASLIEGQFSNLSMVDIFVGGNHACGFNSTGFLICRGINDSGQLDVPSNLAYEYSGLALGENHTCAIRRSNSTVVCWGGNGEFGGNYLIDGVSFESIVAGLDLTCGLTTSNFSVICWGPGWRSVSLYTGNVIASFAKTLPGPCVESECMCGVYPQSQTLCSGSGIICKPCGIPKSEPPTSPPAIPLPPPVGVIPSRSPPFKGLRRGLLAFAIVGSIGALSGICTIIYCIWTGACCGNKKIHNSVQPTINNVAVNPSSSSSLSRSSTLRRQGSRLMRRQRSGTSSKHTDRAEEFTFSDLVAGTNNFSTANKIGAGSFGVVYRGKLLDGRVVAIKRGETGPKTNRFQEKESAFESELAFLSRLHHKHLVRLVGYCEERDERLLVYEYMKNGALYDHLHDKNNVEKCSSVVNSWKIRIKISLDAARGIEYLHNYAVPSIIHRDIKSSNILIDANWTASVSDFGLSLMGPDSEQDCRPIKAAGTVGYIDPEYYGMNVLTAKSDVYGLGVVLLELLTGKRAIFKRGENEGASPMSVVDFAVPAITAGDLAKILDPRVGPPELNEAEAVELVAYTAMHCVNLEGRERPTMTDIVTNLERALSLCDDGHGSMSSGPLSIVSE